MAVDTSHPFFKPLWRRIALVTFCGAWSGFEFYMGEETWGWITAAIFAYAFWAFLITYVPPADSSEDS